MNTNDSRVLPSPPSLIAALRAGFDSITNHIALILFPIALDLYLWLGPHLRLKQLIESVVSQLVALYALQDSGARETLDVIKEAWMEVAAQLNLFAALRSYPVGIPSMMASLSPEAHPAGAPLMWEIDSLSGVFVVWVLITGLGLAAGTLFFDVVSQAVLFGKIDWAETLEQWPKKILQVLLLALFWFGVLVGVSVPGSLIVSVVALGGLTLAQCALFFYGGLLLWLFFHLLLSPHGIFVYGQKALKSIQTSFLLTRQTWLSTALFFLAVFILGRGLDMLWQVPPETSWLALVGVIGHGFVATGLLAASFIYYRDAYQWMKNRSYRENILQNRA
ncbi:MAG TPA: hypothetical protein VIK64_01980 [Anaerolineales bacterium]